MPHPTVKPVALVADALLDCSTRGDIVLDAFLGSGSTLIAAERTGRICCGIEIDPVYMDTAIRRWQRHTGDHATPATTPHRRPRHTGDHATPATTPFMPSMESALTMSQVSVWMPPVRKKKGSEFPVGYKKPPRYTRFKPGQSGNPNGRPRKKATLAESIERELNTRITVNEGAKQRRITKLDAIAKQQTNTRSKYSRTAAQGALDPAESLHRNHFRCRG